MKKVVRDFFFYKFSLYKACQAIAAGAYWPRSDIV